MIHLIANARSWEETANSHVAYWNQLIVGSELELADGYLSVFDPEGQFIDEFIEYDGALIAHYLEEGCRCYIAFAMADLTIEIVE